MLAEKYSLHYEPLHPNLFLKAMVQKNKMVAPFGSWKSPITSDLIVTGSISSLLLLLPEDEDDSNLGIELIVSSQLDAAASIDRVVVK